MCAKCGASFVSVFTDVTPLTAPRLSIPVSGLRVEVVCSMACNSRMDATSLARVRACAGWHGAATTEHQGRFKCGGYPAPYQGVTPLNAIWRDES